MKTQDGEIGETSDSRAKLLGAAVDLTLESLALFIQAVIQGAFILAKAQQRAAVAGDCLDHLRNYLEGVLRK